MSKNNFREIERNLERLQRNIQKIAEPKDFRLDEILNSEFMRKYTKTDNLNDFLEKGSFPTDLESFLKLPIDKLDSYVSETTEFISWQHMMNVAATELQHKRMQKAFKL